MDCCKQCVQNQFAFLGSLINPLQTLSNHSKQGAQLTEKVPDSSLVQTLQYHLLLSLTFCTAACKLHHHDHPCITVEEGFDNFLLITDLHIDLCPMQYLSI